LGTGVKDTYDTNISDFGYLLFFVCTSEAIFYLQTQKSFIYLSIISIMSLGVILLESHHRHRLRFTFLSTSLLLELQTRNKHTTQ